MKRLECTCCGAPLLTNALTGELWCDYCGARYQDESDVIRIKTTPARTREFGCDVVLDSWMIQRDPDMATEYAMHEISERLARAIVPYMQITADTDPARMQTGIRGRIRICEADRERNFDWRW